MNDVIRDLKGVESYEENISEFINDQEKYPEIEIPDYLHDIFQLEYITDEYRNKHFSYYNYNSIGVPRVSEILQLCIAKPFLIQWAAKLGLKKYGFEKHKATTIGTIVHELIESYLLYGNFDKNIMYKCPSSMKKEVLTAFDNFKSWLNNLVNNGFFISDIIAIEKVISCPYFGGTVDCICRINGKVYLVDFKTSKRITPEYILQVTAYTWLINSGYVSNIPRIDGIGIIRVDKEEKNKFEDLFLNFNIPEQYMIIDQYTRTFGVLLQSYYYITNMEIGFSKVKKESKETFNKLKGE